MSDIFDDDVPEMEPVEEETRDDNSDQLAQPVAKKFAFVGCGAAGGRIVDEFYKKGYRRCMAANTCSQDRKGLSDELEFIDLNIGGAGKDPSRARACCLQPANRVQFINFFEEVIGTEADYVFVCAGLGGGTGSGMGPVMIKYLREYIAGKGLKTKIGAILSFPMPQEGSRVAGNALRAYAEFMSLNPSPLILIDNSRVEKIHKSSFAKLYGDANKDACNILHSLNCLAVMPSFQTYDAADFAQLLDSGQITFGVSGVSNWSEGSDAVSKAVMNVYQSATLADVDVSEATQGVLIVVAGENVLNTFSTAELLGGLELLRNSSKTGDMMLHAGVYVNEKNADSMRIYVALGGLKPKKDILSNLARVGQVDMRREEPTIKSSLAKFFGFE